MTATSCRIPVLAGALISLVGCYSKNGGLIDLDAGVGGLVPIGPGPDGGVAGSGGSPIGPRPDGGLGGSGGAGDAPLTGEWQPPVIIEAHSGGGSGNCTSPPRGTRRVASGNTSLHSRPNVENA